MGNLHTRYRDTTMYREITYFEKFRWTISNFSKLDTKSLYSETFIIDGYPWRIAIYPKGDNTSVDHLSIYLRTGDNTNNLPKGCSRFTKHMLAVINQVESQKTIIKEGEQKFNARSPSWGWSKFIPLSELNKSDGGFIMNDACIVEAMIAVRKVVRKVHFKSFGKIEKAFVPLLEEVCSQHPSLIESQQKRSRSFTEWTFTALGRVLYFLKTRKVKDMDEYACRQLQLLWEELETCKFDLTWLQPHIQSALSRESHTQKFVQLKTLKEKVAALEGDLDAELGYGGPN